MLNKLTLMDNMSNLQKKFEIHILFDDSKNYK